MTKFGNGVDNAAAVDDVDDADDIDDGRGRVKYAHADNSDDPDPLPGPKVVRKAGWMGRLLLLLLLLLLAADLAAGLGAIALSAVAVDAAAGGGAVTLAAEEEMASTIAMDPIKSGRQAEEIAVRFVSDD